MDNEPQPVYMRKPESFGKTLAKTSALNAAAIVGMFGGLAAVGAVLDAKNKRRQARESQETTDQK